MLPPKLPLAEYCECPDGRHVNRFLPRPETDAERELIDTYDQAFIYPDPEDLAEAVERFMRDGPTAENLAWARGCADRFDDRVRARRHG